MADTKTTTQKQEEEQVRKITVDAGRLQEALKHTLELEQMLVDCIGLGVPVREDGEQEEKAAAGGDSWKAEKVSLEAQLTEVDVKCPWEGPEEQGAEQRDCPSIPSIPEREAERRNRPPVLERKNRPSVPEEHSPTPDAITKDEIIRIIVRKIKQDRANNELIGAILKSYGVDRVSDLPVEKYETFLMDLTQI